MFKKFFCILVLLPFFHLLSAQTVSVRLGLLKELSCLPCAYLIENNKKLAVQNISFQILDSPQAELSKLLQGELDIGFLSPEDAAKVFTAGKGALLMLGVVQNKNLYLLTNDESYSSLDDLAGKKVLASGDKSDSSLFSYILSKKNISLSQGEEAVHLDFSIPRAEIPNHLILKKENFALLCEPYSSIPQIYSKNVRIAESIHKLYAESEEGSLPPGMLLVVRADFAKENPDLTRRFCDVYKSAVLWTNKNSVKAVMLSKKFKILHFDILPKTTISDAALVWRTSASAKSDIERYLTILGRELPGEEFYKF